MLRGYEPRGTEDKSLQGPARRKRTPTCPSLPQCQPHFTARPPAPTPRGARWGLQDLLQAAGHRLARLTGKDGTSSSDETSQARRTGEPRAREQLTQLSCSASLPLGLFSQSGGSYRFMSSFCTCVHRTCMRIRQEKPRRCLEPTWDV